jgi:polysaccharide biosynthesis transport protein
VAGSETASASDLGSYAALFRRRKIWILTIVPAVLLVAVYLAFALPAQYRSTATLELELSAVPDDFIKSTVRSYADRQIDTIQGRVLTVDTLKELVQQYDPYPAERALSSSDKALKVIEDTSLERVDPVTFQPHATSLAVSLHYQNPDPQRARVVATKLADLFLTYHQRARTESARATAKLIEDRAAALTRELQAVDEEYARLRSANGGTLPDARQGAEDARYRAERDLADLERQLRAAQERESLLSIQLASISPNLMASKGDLTDLATVKAQLALAQQRYTPNHPDVKRLQRALAELTAQGAQTGSGPVMNADNPEYRRIASELAAARTEVAALQAGTARGRAQLAMYAAKVNPSAALEQQVNDLERRRSSLRSQYQEIQDKLKTAQLSQLAQLGANAEHFALLQSPRAASQPYSPNRIAVILLGLILGCALSAAAVGIAESTDATVRGARDIVAVNGLAILGTVPEILLASDEARRRRIWGSVLAVYLAAAVFVTVTIGHELARVHRVEQVVAVSATGHQ